MIWMLHQNYVRKLSCLWTFLINLALCYYYLTDSQKAHIQLVQNAQIIIFLFWMSWLLIFFVIASISKGKMKKLWEKPESEVKSELDLVALDINLFLRHILNWGPKNKGCESSILYGPTQVKKVLTIVFVTTGSDLKCTMKISSNSNVIKSHVLRQRYNFLFYFFHVRLYCLL